MAHVSRVFHTTAEEVVAVRGASLQIRAGETLAVMGASGSGKSTLLHILGLMDAPTSGTYTILGYDVPSLSQSQRGRLRASSIGFVFQSFHLVQHLSVIENVALPLVYAGTKRGERRSRALQALAAVHLTSRADALPSTLSGGEAQRAAIARAMIRDPKILLCDEPTGSLDSKNGQDVLDALRQAAREGSSVVIVTHDEDVARGTSRVARMRDGQLTLPLDE